MKLVRNWLHACWVTVWVTVSETYLKAIVTLFKNTAEKEKREKRKTISKLFALHINARKC